MVKSGTAPFSCMCHLLQNSTIWVGYNFMFWYFHVLVWIDLIGWYGSWVDLIGFLLLVLVGSFVCWFACMKYFKLGFLLLFYGTIVWRKKKVGIASGVFLLWSNLNFMVWIKSWKRKVQKCIFREDLSSLSCNGWWSVGQIGVSTSLWRWFKERWKLYGIWSSFVGIVAWDYGIRRRWNKMLTLMQTIPEFSSGAQPQKHRGHQDSNLQDQDYG